MTFKYLSKQMVKGHKELQYGLTDDYSNVYLAAYNEVLHIQLQGISHSAIFIILYSRKVWW